MFSEITYQFSADKNWRLIQERNISFEEIIAALGNGQLLETLIHPNTEKYPHQKIYVVDVRGYIYLVPFVYVNKHTIFLKTIFPSRKYTNKYLKEKVNHDSQKK